MYTASVLSSLSETEAFSPCCLTIRVEEDEVNTEIIPQSCLFTIPLHCVAELIHDVRDMGGVVSIFIDPHPSAVLPERPDIAVRIGSLRNISL